MRAIRHRCLCGFFALIMGSVAAAQTASSPPASAKSAFAEFTGAQQKCELPVHVTDVNGTPVAQARVIPWALRSSQGHGWWRENDRRAGFDPREVLTDDAGNATVIYPYFRDVQEGIRATAVSLYVDHPDYAYSSDLEIDVPLQGENFSRIKLLPGNRFEVHPTIEGKSIDLNLVFALWSDRRVFQPGAAPVPLENGNLRFPAMAAGEQELLLVRLDEDRATHFSQIVKFNLAGDTPLTLEVPLNPSQQIHGKLSDNVPRPVTAGRVIAFTLPPANAHPERITWRTWTAVKPDGTFTIDGWPTDETLQIIALCDGFVATSGQAPDAVIKKPDPANDYFKRPQVFTPEQWSNLEIAMTPFVRCEVTALDENDQPIPDLEVVSGPNVGWWNVGSQIYGRDLVRWEKFVQHRDYHAVQENAFASPFRARTDSAGKVVLNLPAGKQQLAVIDDQYELPILLGDREIQIQLVKGEVTQVTLRLQAKGEEKLGDWDKLAGVVFGCSTREGKRICALPEVRGRMDEFRKKLEEAGNSKDPQILSEAYIVVADAFLKAGDAEESIKWRQKAEAQAEKAKSKK